MDRFVSENRVQNFLSLCIRDHTRIGSRICWYCNGVGAGRVLSPGVRPFVKSDEEVIDTYIPDSCKYRYLKDQTCTIPLLTKIKDYSFDEAKKCAIEDVKIDAARGLPAFFTPSSSTGTTTESVMRHQMASVIDPARKTP